MAYYKQCFSRHIECFSIVEVLKWANGEVLLEDIKTGLKYVLTVEEFYKYHEILEEDVEFGKE